MFKQVAERGGFFGGGGEVGGGGGDETDEAGADVAYGGASHKTDEFGG